MRFSRFQDVTLGFECEQRMAVLRERVGEKVIACFSDDGPLASNDGTI